MKPIELVEAVFFDMRKLLLRRPKEWLSSAAKISRQQDGVFVITTPVSDRRSPGLGWFVVLGLMAMSAWLFVAIVASGRLDGVGVLLVALLMLGVMTWSLDARYYQRRELTVGRRITVRSLGLFGERLQLDIEASEVHAWRVEPLFGIGLPTVVISDTARKRLTRLCLRAAEGERVVAWIDQAREGKLAE